MKKSVGTARFKAFFSEPLPPLKCLGKKATHFVEIHRRGGSQEEKKIVASRFGTGQFVTGEIRERRGAMAAY